MINEHSLAKVIDSYREQASEMRIDADELYRDLVVDIANLIDKECPTKGAKIEFLNTCGVLE